MFSKTRRVWRSRRHCRGSSSPLSSKSKGPNTPFPPTTDLTSHLWRYSHFICELAVFFPVHEALFVTIFSHVFPFPGFCNHPLCYLPMWFFRQVLASKSTPQQSHWDGSPSPSSLSLITLRARRKEEKVASHQLNIQPTAVSNSDLRALLIKLNSIISPLSFIYIDNSLKAIYLIYNTFEIIEWHCFCPTIQIYAAIKLAQILF